MGPSLKGLLNPSSDAVVLWCSCLSSPIGRYLRLSPFWYRLFTRVVKVLLNKIVHGNLMSAIPEINLTLASSAGRDAVHYYTAY
jgi:hypothetical protein